MQRQAAANVLPAVPHGLAMLVQGLLSLHRQGRAHCDVKPDNIRVLLGEDGTVLHCTLVDLGSSVVYSGEQINTAANSDVATCPQQPWWQHHVCAVATCPTWVYRGDCQMQC